MLFTLGENGILRREVVFDIHRPLLARERPDVAERGEHPVVRTEEFLDGLRLGWGFDYDQIVGHMFTL